MGEERSFGTIEPDSLPSKVIYLYAGPGVSEKALEQTGHTLKKLVSPRYALHKINPDEVIRGAWVKKAALFVMPGGADTPYGQSLNGKGNQSIKAFVQKGGAYLGFCAGAYYGSRQVKFSVGTPLEVVGSRELAFFPGVAEGPTLAPYDEASNAGAALARLQWKGQSSPFSKNQVMASYYNGGCHFVNASACPNVTVLADYAATSPLKAAIVEMAVGKGRVILSGVHCEFDPALLDPLDPYLLPIQKELCANNQGRLALMAHLLNRLNIETVPI